MSTELWTLPRRRWEWSLGHVTWFLPLRSCLLWNSDAVVMIRIVTWKRKELLPKRSRYFRRRHELLYISSTGWLTSIQTAPQTGKIIHIVQNDDKCYCACEVCCEVFKTFYLKFLTNSLGRVAHSTDPIFSNVPPQKCVFSRYSNCSGKNKAGTLTFHSTSVHVRAT